MIWLSLILYTHAYTHTRTPKHTHAEKERENPTITGNKNYIIVSLRHDAIPDFVS